MRRMIVSRKHPVVLMVMALAILLAAGVAQAVGQSKAFIINGGQARADIVVAASPTCSESLAAEEAGRQRGGDQVEQPRSAPRVFSGRTRHAPPRRIVTAAGRPLRGRRVEPPRLDPCPAEWRANCVFLRHRAP